MLFAAAAFTAADKKIHNWKVGFYKVYQNV